MMLLEWRYRQKFILLLLSPGRVVVRSFLGHPEDPLVHPWKYIQLPVVRTCLRDLRYEERLNECGVTTLESWRLKLKLRKYPSIHTNYIISHCTILQYNHNIWYGSYAEWPAYDGGRKRENSSAWKHRIIIASTRTGVEIALIRLSGLSKTLSGQVDPPTEVIRRTSR